jgi:hypothetical protein
VAARGVSAGPSGRFRFGFSWMAAVSPRKPPFDPIGFPWICLDSLVRIVTFQWVTWVFRLRQFLAPFPFVRSRARERSLWPYAEGGIGHRDKLSPNSDFPQEIVGSGNCRSLQPSEIIRKYNAFRCPDERPPEQDAFESPRHREHPRARPAGTWAIRSRRRLRSLGSPCPRFPAGPKQTQAWGVAMTAWIKLKSFPL